MTRVEIPAPPPAGCTCAWGNHTRTRCVLAAWDPDCVWHGVTLPAADRWDEPIGYQLAERAS